MSGDDGRHLAERVAILETWHSAHAQALDRQANEYERRLTELDKRWANEMRALKMIVGAAVAAAALAGYIARMVK